MHITILALGSHGDIQPYAALGRGLKNRGHEVRFITFESFRSAITASGLDFYSIHGDAQALVTNAGAKVLALIRSFGSQAERYTRDLSAPMLGETDLLINQLPAGVFGKDLAEKYGIQMVLASVIPLARTHVFPLIGFPRLQFPAYNNFTYTIGEQLIWQMFRSRINLWRKQSLNLPPTSWKRYFDQSGTRRFPLLNGFSPLVVPRPADWGENIHLTGYWIPQGNDWQPETRLVEFLELGSRPVFVGFGSMPLKDPQRATRIIIEALQRSGTRGILHSGWGGLGDWQLPTDVIKIDYAPYAWLFPKMAMVVHHGGSGTTALALHSGVPSCVVPFIFDQFFWGKRTSALGVGPDPIPYKKLTTGRLAEAIRIGTSSLSMQERATDLALNLNQEDGIQNAVEIIESGKLRTRF